MPPQGITSISSTLSPPVPVCDPIISCFSSPTHANPSDHKFICIYICDCLNQIYMCVIYIYECLNQIYICECLNQFVRTSTNIIELIRYNQCYRTNSSSPTTLFNNSSNSDNIIKKFVQPYNIVQQLVQFNQYHITTRPILQHFPTIGGWDPNSKEYLSIPHLACSYLKLKQKARSRPRHSKGMINETKLEVLYKNQA